MSRILKCLFHRVARRYGEEIALFFQDPPNLIHDADNGKDLFLSPIPDPRYMLEHIISSHAVEISILKRNRVGYEIAFSYSTGGLIL